MNAPTPSTLAALVAAGSAAIGGSSAVALRYAVGESDPLTITALRTAIASLCMLAIVLPTTRIRIARGDLPILAALAAMHFGLYSWLFATALVYVPAGRVTIIMSTQPIVTMLLSTATGRESFTLAKLAGVVMAAAGVGLALSNDAGADHAEAWKGDAIMGAANFVAAAYNVSAGIFVRRYPAIVVTSMSLPIGATALTLALLMSGDLSGIAALSLGGWLAVLYLGTIAGALIFFMWLWALERTTPTRVAIMVTINPVSAILLAALLLGEPVTIEAMLGFVAIVAGIVLTQRPSPRP